MSADKAHHVQIIISICIKIGFLIRLSIVELMFTFVLSTIIAIVADLGAPATHPLQADIIEGAWIFIIAVLPLLDLNEITLVDLLAFIAITDLTLFRPQLTFIIMLTVAVSTILRAVEALFTRRAVAVATAGVDTDPLFADLIIFADGKVRRDLIETLTALLGAHPGGDAAGDLLDTLLGLPLTAAVHVTQVACRTQVTVITERAIQRRVGASAG